MWNSEFKRRAVRGRVTAGSLVLRLGSNAPAQAAAAAACSSLVLREGVSFAAACEIVTAWLVYARSVVEQAHAPVPPTKRARQLSTLAKQSRDLAQSIAAFEDHVPVAFDVALGIKQGAGLELYRSGSAEFLQVTRENLQKLSAALEACIADASSLQTLRSPAADKHDLANDLSAIFVYLTAVAPARRNQSVKHDPGKPYGPFWAFAEILWVALFGTVYGLDNALKERTAVPFTWLDSHLRTYGENLPRPG